MFICKFFFDFVFNFISFCTVWTKKCNHIKCIFYFNLKFLLLWWFFFLNFSQLWIIEIFVFFSRSCVFLFNSFNIILNFRDFPLTFFQLLTIYLYNLVLKHSISLFLQLLLICFGILLYDNCLSHLLSLEKFFSTFSQLSINL